MATNISQYFGRYGVITEEQDFSVITTADSEAMAVLAIGFSKKGQFNKPILITNNSSQERIIGTEDRNLERRASFLHRTVSKLTPYVPVYVLNLLATDDTLDRLEYISTSTATEFTNDDVRNAPYRRFFDTTGFWERKTDNFIDITRTNDSYNRNLINFTNFSDKYVTMFIFKSSVGGFDVNFQSWYGSSSDKPEFVNDLEFVSEYMVDVLVVAGDYTNYQQLASDNYWGQYFNASGLRKDRLRNFANDTNSGTLGFYTGLSLIPNFRDKEGKNIYIETVINADTDYTGLYCAINEDILYTEYRNGLIDLVGYGLVGKDIKEVNFLSYKDLIVETVDINTKQLDSLGNVYGIYNANLTGRTNNYMDNVVNGLIHDITITNSDTEVNFDFVATNPTFYKNGLVININPSSYVLDVSTLADDTYSMYAILNNNGTISYSDSVNIPALYNSNNSIVLYKAEVTVLSGEATSVTTEDYYISNTGISNLVYGTNNVTDDYVVTQTGIDGEFKITFYRTSNTPTTVRDFKIRSIFNNLMNVLTSSRKNEVSFLVSTSGIKHSFENCTARSINTVGNNLEIIITTDLSDLDLVEIHNGLLVFYKKDDEFILGSNGATTTNVVASTTDGVVSKYSEYYDRYYNGAINSYDYFNENIIDKINNETIDIELDSATNKLIIIGQVNLMNLDKITIPKTNNTPEMTLTLSNPVTVGGSTTFDVDENIQSSISLFDISYLTNGNKIKLNTWLNDGILYIRYADEDNNQISYNDIINNPTLHIVSGKSNFIESLDVIYPNDYTRSPNKILVDASRYTSIRVGDFLVANVIENEEYMEEVPRTLTRILRKMSYAPNPTLVEIICDSEINVVNNQATKYTTIENYINTYKGIKLKGFRVRKESMPDGTEERQKQILNIVEKGTPLFDALTNKNAINFRYVVDTFGLGLTENSKQQLVDICGERLDCFGILSAPSMKQFKNSSSPSFVDNEYVLKTEYIAKGANPDSNPTFLFSLGVGRGSTCVGYFAPYIDTGSILVPPAMFVAETYLQKHVSTNSMLHPWTISAGSTNGKLRNIPNLEMNFTDNDIYWLSMARINPIVYKRTKGYVIETEFTAQTTFTSALSYIHSREVLIELESDLRVMLYDYQWKFNTSQNRAEIKLKADQICAKYVALEGLTMYFNKCDSTNNTVDYIDNQIGKLDTGVEITKGLGLFINNVSVYRTGGIESSGFA